MLVSLLNGRPSDLCALFNQDHRCHQLNLEPTPQFLNVSTPIYISQLSSSGSIEGNKQFQKFI
ncbi:hypothetical protein BYT27DRAFT_7182470 [Phlegmacium glaucopus]|nr:hypothetical protein BYT27DRAFT_7182470 [Phlegmacium glaucopus]